MAKTIIATLYEHDALSSIINELTRAGIPREDIGIVAKNPRNISGVPSNLFNTSFSSEQIPSLLRDMDLNDQEIKYYTGQLDNNAVLLLVNARTEQDVNRIQSILADRGLAVTEGELTQRKRATRSGAKGKGEVVLPVTEEELQVGKRTVERGGVRIHQRVTERPIHESVRLREEHVTVERRPVDRPISADDTSRIQEGSFEMTEQAEEPVVSKQARVVEEVVVRKDVEEREQHISDKVRHADVDVERMQAGGMTSPRTEASSQSFASEANIPMDLQKIDEESYFEIGKSKHNPKGWKVIGPDDDKIGEIEYLLGNPADRKAYLAVVDLGGFFTNKHVAIPVSYMDFRPEEEKVYVPYDKDQLKDSPDFDSSTTDFRRYFDYWREAPTHQQTMVGKER